MPFSGSGGTADGADTGGSSECGAAKAEGVSLSPCAATDATAPAAPAPAAAAARLGAEGAQHAHVVDGPVDSGAGADGVISSGAEAGAGGAAPRQAEVQSRQAEMQSRQAEVANYELQVSGMVHRAWCSSTW